MKSQKVADPLVSGDNASDYVWGLVCGLPNPSRENRYLLMLKAFFDDSQMRQPPVYVLAGWVAQAKTWVAFSDAWQEVLRMSPRIRYFKFTEAMNFRGEFNGMSSTSRDEKMGLLLRVIEDHKLLGAASVIPHHIFQSFFGNHPDPHIRNPYFPSIFGLVAKILQHHKEQGINERLSLFFDYQPGSDQMKEVQDGWEMFRDVMPEEFRDLVQSHPPSFLDDREFVALQAADLHAGWIRSLWTQVLGSQEPPYWPWGDRDIDIPSIILRWTEDFAADIFEDLIGYRPVRPTFTFHYGYRPRKVS